MEWNFERSTSDFRLRLRLCRDKSNVEVKSLEAWFFYFASRFNVGRSVFDVRAARDQIRRRRRWERESQRSGTGTKWRWPEANSRPGYFSFCRQFPNPPVKARRRAERRNPLRRSPRNSNGDARLPITVPLTLLRADPWHSIALLSLRCRCLSLPGHHPSAWLRIACGHW